MLDLWDVFQQAQIADAAGKAEGARYEAQRAQDGAFALERRLEGKVDHLALITQALWELLRERTNLSDADVEAKMAEIDARDGRRDGRITGQMQTCDHCGRPTHSRQRTCLYCGAPVAGGLLVERLPVPTTDR